MLKKPRQYDPQMGQAVDCPMTVLAALLALDGALAAAVVFDLGWLVSAVFVVVVIPFAWVLTGLVYNPVRWARRRLRGE